MKSSLFIEENDAQGGMHGYRNKNPRNILRGAK